MKKLLQRYMRFALLILSLLISACGFHPRSANDIPPQLHTLQLVSSEPYGAFTVQLRAMLKSLHIQLNKSSASYTLKINSVTFSQENPPLTTTAVAVTLTYTLHVSLILLDHNGKAIIPEKTLYATQSISQNASQVYTPGTATLVKQELQRDIISQVYYLLTSNNTHRALSHGRQ